MFIFFNKAKREAKMPFATDVHCHVLPGVDDGAPDVAASVELLEKMEGWGVKKVWASPHVTEGRFENTRAGLDAVTENLRQAIAERGMGVEINHHAEYRLDDYSLSFFEQNDVMAMPGGYVMIENPFVSEAWFIDNTIFDLQVKGFVPVLAHPERYSYYFKNFGRYKALHDMGTRFQINLLSLAGAYGSEQREVAERLIADGMVEFVGTDLHNQNHARIIDDYLRTKKAAQHFAPLEGRLLNDQI